MHSPRCPTCNTLFCSEHCKLKNIQVVAGIIRNIDGKLLIAKRPIHKPLGGLWEFPGGKIEPKETPLEALSRELFEEVGIEVIAATVLINAQQSNKPQNPLAKSMTSLEVWNVHQYHGKPYGKEGQQIRWVTTAELKLYDFPPANAEIIKCIEA